VREALPRIALVAGAPREALCPKTPLLRPPEGLVVAGTVRGLGEACRHCPLGPLSTEDALANDQRGAADLRAALPGGGRLSFALGVGSVRWCDDGTTTQRFLVPRLRATLP